MRAVTNRLITIVLIAAVGLLAACGAGSSRDAVASIALVGGKPANVTRIEVGGGYKVKLTVTSDQADRVHVHGYDLEFDVPAGGEVTKEFVADQLGSYEIETHPGGVIIAQLVVR